MGRCSEPNCSSGEMTKDDATVQGKKKKKEARLEFSKLHVDKPQKNVPLSDGQKLELFGKTHQLHVHRHQNEARIENNAVSTVKDLWRVQRDLKIINTF